MLEKILTYFQNSEERALIKSAYELAWKAHRDQKRESGEPYIQHPLSVALSLTKMNLDIETITAALLHDVVEDSEYTLSDIEAQFGKAVAFLVNGVTKLNKIQYTGVEGRAENLRKMFLAMAQDIRVVLIKLSDRYHNMLTLDALEKPDQKRIALETLEIYAPLANRLGMGELKGQLEDLAFKHLYPEEYDRLENEVSEKYETRKNYIKKLTPVIYEILKKENVTPLEINARAKYFYSLYKKLLRHQMNFDKIHDLVAARIIVKDIEDCYLTLGAIHQTWKPVPGLIKDYISMPKPNGYQSLHTSVFGPEGKITEIQIRTPEMHAKAENGIAAHWAYKEQQYRGRNPEMMKKELLWIEQLREWQHAVRGTDEFFESLKIDFFKDRIFVLTPKGDVLDLPEGATPVDFAYQVHTTIGHECAGAKVNGKIASLDAKLESGDLVEIMTQKGKRPSSDWLNFVKTNLAKDRIKNSLRSKDIKLINKTKKLSLTELKITVRDRIGLLKDISNIISLKKINIISISTDAKNKNFPVLNFVLNLKEKNKLQNLVLELKKTKGVEEVSYKL
ncbi:MAG: RelA/SpoT family protein [bacterium]|nr:RelA/SpoT family protein [bacterium]